MTMSMRWVRRGAIALAVLLAAGFAVGSMTSSSYDEGLRMDGSALPGETHEAVGFDAASKAIGGGVAMEDSFDTVGPTLQTAPVDEASTFGDHIIKTAMLSMQVPEGTFEEAWTTAGRIAREAGGEVIGSSRGGGDVYPVFERTDEPSPFGTITIRVPSDSLDAVTARLRANLGEVVSESTSSEDVSQEFVDLKSRLRNLRAEESALVALFAQADSVRDTLAVRERLSAVRGEIEQVTGRIRFIEDRTAFSTITLNLAEPGAAIGTLRSEDPSFGQAWETALEGLVRIATTAMIAAIWLVPFAVLALIALALRKRMQPPAPQV